MATFSLAYSRAKMSQIYDTGLCTLQVYFSRRCLWIMGLLMLQILIFCPEHVVCDFYSHKCRHGAWLFSLHFPEGDVGSKFLYCATWSLSTAFSKVLWAVLPQSVCFPCFWVSLQLNSPFSPPTNPFLYLSTSAFSLPPSPLFLSLPFLSSPSLCLCLSPFFLSLCLCTGR